MKARLKKRSLVAAVSAASVALIGFVAVPAHADTRSTVVAIESNTFTSYNNITPDTNIVINGDVQYLTGSPIFYYDDKLNIVPNPKLATWKITKNLATDFEVTYTIQPGRLWSDGVPITAADLLLSHVTTSSDYSKAAGLGDPAGSSGAAFNSVNYGGVYDAHIAGIPVISNNGMSITFKYDSKIPDYLLNGPGLEPMSVHALEELAAGKTDLGSVADGVAADAKFIKDVTTKNTSALLAMGKIWSNSYNFTTVDSSTNPLLLVNNGAYHLKSVDSSQITMVASPNYNSGPALSGINTLVIKQGIADGSPSAQAIANGDADVYQGQPSADAVAQLKAIKSATVLTTSSLAFEHIELRVASSGSDTYNGPFAMSGGQKAADLRKAFLLAYPRADIVQKLVQPINPHTVVLGSVIDLPGNPQYEHVASLNRMNLFNKGTQASRTAQALALVKKWYPKAGKGNTPIAVNLLWGSPGNTRRTSEAALIIAAEAAVGFKVTAPATAGWGGKLTATQYDAHFFIFDQTANPQDAQSCGIFQDGGGSNYTGINDPAINKACVALQATTLPSSTVTRLRIQIEQAVAKDAFFLGIFQNPEVTAFNSQLQNVVPAPLSPNLFWNFWTWHF